jgi:hypothetical protein
MRATPLILIAVLALSALATSSASAESPPEVGRCKHMAGGKFKDGGCKVAAVPGEEKDEWFPAFVGGVPNPEPSLPMLGYSEKWKEGTLIQLESVGGEKIIFHGFTATGEVTGAKAAVLQNVVLTGCEGLVEPECRGTNPKASNPGEVRIKDLVGELGIEKFNPEGNHAKDKAAWVLKPKDGSGILTEFMVTGVPIVLRGELMVPAASNGMKLTATVKRVAVKAKQKPEKFATDPPELKRVLELNKLGGPFEQVGLTLTTIQTNEEKVEVSTVN